MGRITLNGFVVYMPTLFDNVELPDGLDHDTLVNEIMYRCGDLYPYYQVPNRLKENITIWFQRRYYDFDMMVQALRTEYNPLDNYNRTEENERNITNSGSDVLRNTLGSTDTITRSSTVNDSSSGTAVDTHTVAAFNSNNYEPREKNENSHGDTRGVSENSTDTNARTGTDTATQEHGHKVKDTYTSHVHGNIGVTTSQQMLESEINLRDKYDIYEIIAREFEKQFIVQVY